MSSAVDFPLSADRIDALREPGERYGVSDIRVVGSLARGDVGPDSDLDLLVSLDDGVASFGGSCAFARGLLAC